MKTHRKKPAPYPIISRSGFDIRFPSSLPILKDGCFRVLDAAVAGGAPKDFLRIYRYGDGQRANSRNWPAWIAKVGHKYYPNESVTEHGLMSPIRAEFIQRCLDRRATLFHEAVANP